MDNILHVGPPNNYHPPGAHTLFLQSDPILIVVVKAFSQIL